MQLTRDDYTVGWIAALPSELASARAMLDEIHDTLDALAGDSNVYAFGRIGSHNVVIAGLPNGVIGTTAASTTAINLIRSFKNVRFGLMVGIGGGVPGGERDIRLGDIVVSKPLDKTGGVIQYDLGKNRQYREFNRQGFLRSPPAVLQKAVTMMIAVADMEGYQFPTYHQEMLERYKRMKLKYSRPETDILYEADYEHEGTESDCSACDASRIIKRDGREEPEVHYGTIGSGNQVVKNAVDRDRWHKEEGIICFEMEAAGLMNDFECMVIRGICDYCDTHKNDKWQPYAAAIAAAYAKELLLTTPVKEVEAMPRSKILDSIYKEVKGGTETLQRIEQRQALLLAQETLVWVGAPDAESSYRIALELQESNTGRWLLDSEIFKEWMTADKGKSSVDDIITRHLWLYGQAGCGKSVLSAIAIEELREYCSKTKTGLGIFYFTFSDPSKYSWQDCLKSLVVQLIVNTPAMSRLIEERTKHGKSPDEKTLYDILLIAIQSYPKVFIVLDGLDESPISPSGNSTVRNVLLTQLGQLTKDAPQVNLLLTSRDLPDIKQQMIRLSAHQIPMTIESVNSDIEKYLDTRLRVDQTLSLLDPKTQGDIKHALMEKADGMFRWAQCQIQQLSRLTTMRPSEIQKILETLPENLDQTYERMLEEIPARSKEKAAFLLQWLVCVKRPLNIMELSETLIISLKPDTVDFDDRARRPEGVLDDLTGLVKTRSRPPKYLPGYLQESKFSEEQRQQQKRDFSLVEIELAHLSVKEYLESRRNSSSVFQFNTDFGNDLLLNCCLAYIFGCANSKQRVGSREDLKTFPLLRYAAEFWYKHYHEDSEPERIVSLLRSRERLKVCCTVYHATGSWEIPLSEREYDQGDQQGLWIASYLGMYTVVRILLEKYGGIANGRVGTYGTMLQAASRGGNGSIVKLLLAAGANVNAEPAFFGNALHEATIGGHEDVVKILLEAGIDVNAGGGRADENALQLASSMGNENLVRLFLAAGADLNKQRGRSGNTAISSASGAGHEGVVKLLLAAGVNVNANAGRGGSALQAAVKAGHENIVKLLLAAGAK